MRPLINQIFEGLERSFGAVLVRTTFALLTFSVQGVSDGEMVDLLRGGGAVAGFALAWQSLNQMVQMAIRLRTEMAAGQKTWGDVVEELAGGLPIIGGWVQTGLNIKELLEGT